MTRLTRAAAAAATLALLGAACATPQARCEVAPRGSHGSPLLWRVERDGGAAVWLYGTIHDAGAEDVPPAVWAALDRAPAFVSELGDETPDPRELAELARLPWGQVLDHMLPADDWWELVTAMAGAMSQDELRHARPWFAMVRLRAHMARSPRPSMDDALAVRARERGIAVRELETWRQQLAALSASVTVADLSTAIRGRHAVACDLARLRAAYRTSDLTALAAMLVIPGRGELLGERNRRWMPQIEQYLAGGGAFIAIGLGHLIGDDGLLTMLARAGYRVEPHGAPVGTGPVARPILCRR